MTKRFLVLLDLLKGILSTNKDTTKNSPEIQQTEPLDKRLILEELRRAFDKAFASVDILDGKLQTTLNFTGLIISFAGILQLPHISQKTGLAYLLSWIIVILLAITYFRLFIVVFRALKPGTSALPISHNWNELAQHYFGESEDKILLKLISDHLTAIDKINELAARKSKAVECAMWLFAIIVGYLSAFILITIS